MCINTISKSKVTKIDKNVYQFLLLKWNEEIKLVLHPGQKINIFLIIS